MRPGDLSPGRIFVQPRRLLAERNVMPRCTMVDSAAPHG